MDCVQIPTAAAAHASCWTNERNPVACPRPQDRRTALEAKPSHPAGTCQPVRVLHPASPDYRVAGWACALTGRGHPGSWVLHQAFYRRAKVTAILRDWDQAHLTSAPLHCGTRLPPPTGGGNRALRQVQPGRISTVCAYVVAQWITRNDWSRTPLAQTV